MQIQEFVSAYELKDVDAFADEWFGKLGIDVAFTDHFKERLNDGRNGEPITAQELEDLFRKEAVQWGRSIASRGYQHSVMKDMSTDINIPFVLTKNNDIHNPEPEYILVAKTIMRKDDFRTGKTQTVYPVESITESDTRGYNDGRLNPHQLRDLIMAEELQEWAAVPKDVVSCVTETVFKETGKTLTECGSAVWQSNKKFRPFIRRFMESGLFWHRMVTEFKNSGKLSHIDPRMRPLVNKAVEMYPHADSEFEAFAMYMQKDDKEQHELEKDVAELEQDVTDLEIRMAKLENPEQQFLDRATAKLEHFAAVKRAIKEAKTNNQSCVSLQAQANLLERELANIAAQSKELLEARNPHHQDLAALRRSGAGGSHGDRKKQIPRKAKGSDKARIMRNLDEDAPNRRLYHMHGMNWEMAADGEHRTWTPKHPGLDPAIIRMFQDSKGVDLDVADENGVINNELSKKFDSLNTAMQYMQDTVIPQLQAAGELPDGLDVVGEKTGLNWKAGGHALNVKGNPDQYVFQRWPEQNGVRVEGAQVASYHSEKLNGDAIAVVAYAPNIGKKYFLPLNEKGYAADAEAMARRQAMEFVESAVRTGLSESILDAISEGVGKVTKQNATIDVPVGGEYMNVKGVGLDPSQLKCDEMGWLKKGVKETKSPHPVFQSSMPAGDIIAHVNSHIREFHQSQAKKRPVTPLNEWQEATPGQVNYVKSLLRQGQIPAEQEEDVKNKVEAGSLDKNEASDLISKFKNAKARTPDSASDKQIAYIKKLIGKNRIKGDVADALNAEITNGTLSKNRASIALNLHTYYSNPKTWKRPEKSDLASEQQVAALKEIYGADWWKTTFAWENMLGILNRKDVQKFMDKRAGKKDEPSVLDKEYAANAEKRNQEYFARLEREKNEDPNAVNVGLWGSMKGLITDSQATTLKNMIKDNFDDIIFKSSKRRDLQTGEPKMYTKEILNDFLKRVEDRSMSKQEASDLIDSLMMNFAYQRNY